ncbi:MATE family efflux transporter [Cuneatibacter sp. NSJ-177]|uniref:MATE family efflux transporter n=1 Tax=Cuneatibacter sp. NSJ-177 TaxID=2931401 RepID=UPI001FD50963|nr:MATE family efflux transporter [Cuneatibacter sp. NSJ-177]MCJ7837124.1 MATE family efflux transporter [Cuneatibacter sp. NSJ-177]
MEKENSVSSKEKTLIKDLTVGSVPRQLLIFALPLVLSGILQAAYNMVDMIVVGRYLESAGLSAVSIGGDVLMVLTFVAMGFSNAAQIIISQYVGANRPDKVSKMIGTLFSFLGGCALVMTVVCLLLRNSILQWVKTPVESWDYTMDYVVTCMAGLVFIYGYNLVSAILRGMGDSRHPFLFIAIASVLNAVLDLLFIAVFDLGVFGAALATVIGQAVSFVCALVILYRKRKEFMFDFKLKSFRISLDMLKPLISLGVPMSIQSAAVSISRVYVNSWVNSYGVIASAVSGMGHKLEMVNNTIVHGFTTAGASMVAQCIGAKKYGRVTKVILTSFVINGIFGAIFILCTVCWPRAVFGIFTSDTLALDMAVTYVPVAVVSFIGGIIRPSMFSLINGSGNSKLNLAVALLDGIIARIGLAMLLGLVFDMGVYGFWYGNAFAGWVPFFIGTVYYFSGRWRKSGRLVN